MSDITRIFFGERGSSLRICCLGREFVLCRLLGALLLCLHLLLELRGHLDHLEVLHEVLRSVEALDRRVGVLGAEEVILAGGLIDHTLDAARAVTQSVVWYQPGNRISDAGEQAHALRA